MIDEETDRRFTAASRIVVHGVQSCTATETENVGSPDCDRCQEIYDVLADNLAGATDYIREVVGVDPAIPGSDMTITRAGELLALPPGSTDVIAPDAGVPLLDAASTVFFMHELTHDADCQVCKGTGVCSDCQGTGLNHGRVIRYAAPVTQTVPAAALDPGEALKAEDNADTLFRTGPSVPRLDLPEPLPNTGASAADGGPELVEDSKKGEKSR